MTCDRTSNFFVSTTTTATTTDLDTTIAVAPSTAAASTMAPKKKTARAAPTIRRSARLASREPSLEAPSVVSLEPEEAGLLSPSLLTPFVRDPLQGMNIGQAANDVLPQPARSAATAWSVEGFTSLIRATRELWKFDALTRRQAIDLATTTTVRMIEAEEALEASLAREAARERREPPSIKRDFGLKQITAAYEAKQRLLIEQAPEVRPLQSMLLVCTADTTLEKPQTVRSAPSPAPSPPANVATPSSRVSAEQSLATPVQQETAAPPPPSAFSRLLRNVGGYFSSPFPRKRAAEEEEPERSQKRVRVEETQQEELAQDEQTTLAPATPTPSQPRGEEISRCSGTATKRAAENDDADDNDTAETTDAAGTSRASKRARVDEPEAETPRPTFQQPHSRPSAKYSAKSQRLATSLSTITEYTEPSQNSIIQDSTPSKPSRTMNSRGLQAPQNTPAMTPRRAYPASSLRSSTLSNASSLPQSTPTQGFAMRRSIQVRAAKMAQQQNQSIEKPYSWERLGGTPRPKEPNADARLAKVQKIRDLEKELQRLKEDEDIKDIEAHSIHRRKRVKIDDLAVIPHNRPGDSSSTFRVPDYDSDEEIEVEDSMDLSGNMFEGVNQTQGAQNEQVQTQTPLPATAPYTTPHQQPTTSLNQHSASPTIAQVTEQQPQQATEPQAPKSTEQAPLFAFPSVSSAQQHQATEPQAPLPQEQAPLFIFPSVRKKPRDYEEPSEEYKAAAGRDFTKGYNEWLAAF